jgi:GalNAc-alpha-(1->4)-GalNAc-alpha-(1->3)-diNAcBac-PP-undecaprenol alpha-1,4-N-acetyl-D-galactosaminyltransferase
MDCDCAEILGVRLEEPQNIAAQFLVDNNTAGARVKGRSLHAFDPVDGRAGLSRVQPIALYFHRLGASGGGARRMICLLANALCEREFPVHMITWDVPDTHSFYPLDPRIVWSRLGFRSTLVDKLRRTQALARLLQNNQVRILVGFVMSGDKTVYAAAKWARTRLIVAERSAPTIYKLRYSFAQRWLSFSMLRLADRITVQMPDFIGGYPASLRDRIEVIPNPVPVAEHRAQPGVPGIDGHFNLLAAGRLGAEKCYECLIGAFAKIAQRHPTWGLRIVGDGPQRETLRLLAARFDLEERVHLEPWVSDISRAYTSSHLFVMPSLWEGFPNALAEAMSHGLPAVGFRDASGVANLIADGETGWLADGLDDEVALARTLSYAMGDGVERARRGVRAAESMAIYAPEVQFDHWAKLLRTLSNKDGV